MRAPLVGLAVFALLACGGSPSGGIGTPETATTKPSPTPTPVLGADVCTVDGKVYCLTNPAVTFATRATTICKSGWTKTVRPPATYTDALKLRQLAAEGLTGGPASVEEDHRLPLEGGGFPGGAGTDEHNLSPESHAKSSTKDGAENGLKRQLCGAKDEATFSADQLAFIQQWLLPWPSYK